MGKYSREIIEGNVRQEVKYGRADLNEPEIQKAVEVGLAAFTGQTSNGEATRIGIEAVRRLRR